MGQALSGDRQMQKHRDHSVEFGAHLRRKVSDNVAYGLLVYTGLHIFVTLTQLKSGGGSILPYLALVVLLAAIVPACRMFERRWEQLTTGAVESSELASLFRREMGLFWLCATGLPIGLTFLFKGVMAMF